MILLYGLIKVFFYLGSNDYVTILKVGLRPVNLPDKGKRPKAEERANLTKNQPAKIR